MASLDETGTQFPADYMSYIGNYGKHIAIKDTKDFFRKMVFSSFHHSGYLSILDCRSHVPLWYNLKKILWNARSLGALTCFDPAWLRPSWPWVAQALGKKRIKCPEIQKKVDKSKKLLLRNPKYLVRNPTEIHSFWEIQTYHREIHEKLLRNPKNFVKKSKKKLLTNPKISLTNPENVTNKSKNCHRQI